MPESQSQFSLAVGDRVVYPNQGVCRVFGVEVKEVAGQKLSFVTMKREEDGALVMVPEAKVNSIGLRKVATADEVTKIFVFLQSDSDKANLDWKQRARTNSDRMATGGILGVAEVVKGLQVLSELRPLPTKERELYDTARHLLVSEIAAAMTLTECDAEDAVDLVLFPPGRERPKRTAEEFKIAGAEDDTLELVDDLLPLGGELELRSEPDEAIEGSEETAAEGEGDKVEDDHPKASATKAHKSTAGKHKATAAIKKASKAKPKAAAAPKAAKAKKATARAAAAPKRTAKKKHK
jgi:RNA polymerase-interacting CarD/CdnL/TRCF family regulator